MQWNVPDSSSRPIWITIFIVILITGLSLLIVRFSLFYLRLVCRYDNTYYWFLKQDVQSVTDRYSHCLNKIVLPTLFLRAYSLYWKFEFAIRQGFTQILYMIWIRSDFILQLYIFFSLDISISVYGTINLFHIYPHLYFIIS